jgi:hypothetical protein
MQLLLKDDVKTLMAERSPGCVSIYLPTGCLGTGMRPGPIQLRNLLREAAERLRADGWQPRDVETLLGPVQDLLGDGYVWRQLSEGMALFASPSFFRYYFLPRAFDPLVVVSRRFHVKPLLPLLPGIEAYYVLALSQNSVRLFRGTRFDLAEVSLEHGPHRLAEAIQPVAQEKTLRFHTAAPVSRGHWASTFYTGGAGAADAKPMLRQFCREVEQAVHNRLMSEEAPLVLAGVEYLLALYREANRYAHLAEQEIVGSPERLRLADLHAEAWAIVQPHFQRKGTEAVARYGQLDGGPRASAHLRVVVPAACHGRVEVLLVAEGREQWGTYDPDTGQLELHPNREPEDEDLLDVAATYSLLAGGMVYMISPDQMPTPAPLAAIFRY